MILYNVKNREDTHKIIENILINPDSDYYLFPRQYGITTAMVNIVNQGGGKYAYLGQSGRLDEIKRIAKNDRLNHKLFHCEYASIIRNGMIGEPFELLYIDNRYWIFDKPLDEQKIMKLKVMAKRIVYVAAIDFDGISNVNIPSNKKLQIVQFAVEDDKRYAQMLSEWEQMKGKEYNNAI